MNLSGQRQSPFLLIQGYMESSSISFTGGTGGTGGTGLSQVWLIL